jgi:hypothetical protein
LDRERGRGRCSPSMARVPVSFALAPSNLGDAVLLGAPRGDDEVRLGVANAWVVAAAWIRSRWRAGARLEAAGVAAQSGVILTAWWRICCLVRQRNKRGRRGTYRRRALGEGFRVWARRCESDGVGGSRDWAGLVEDDV